MPLSRIRRRVRGFTDMKAALWDNRRRRLRRAMAVPCEERLALFDFDDEDDLNVSKNSLSGEKSPFFDKDEKKCPPVADPDEKKCPPAVDADEKRSPPTADGENKCPPAEVDENMEDEVCIMLDKLRDRITNSLLEKIRRMQTYSETVSKQTSYKMKQAWETKQQQMLKVNNKYYQQFMDLFKQWELEKQKYEKQQKHLINILQQQKMMLRQCKIKQNQRMKLVMQMYTQYIQNLKHKNNNKFTDSFTELKEEIAEYQRKYMMKTQKQEIANIRKSLQSILFS
uniref:synaptonemal complex protein 3-like n=1 Tax=Myodes glareolus TaxID=447135 RepID=UPI0020207F3D|nr:synaptonemal complex protein 3-like [Myodes glareolus]